MGYLKHITVCLLFLATAALVVAQSVVITCIPRYAFGFTGETEVVITGATHQLGTADLTLQCFDGSTPRQAIEPDTWTVDANSFDVTIYFAEPQDGRCVLR